MNYGKYRFSVKEKLLVGLSGVGLLLLISLLFYRSLWAMAAGAPFLPLWVGICRKQRIRKRNQELTFEFRECMQAVSGALLAGYSLENAWKEAEKDIKLLHGEASHMYRELHDMNGQLAMQQPLEKLLADFGERSGLEDVSRFCQVMQFAKRSGGNFSQIIATTVKRIGDKIEITREIDTVIAQKRLESGIMALIPAAIILYLTFCSPGYLDVLYHNITGVFIMSGCLAVYIFGIWMSVKIVQGVEL
ncbi:MAG: pilus assembly protein TadB [Eubacterium sp.]|jgi:Flp pilus assembly protein TadB|nr:pilus assembly protein TadB [Eubacterium sp.]